MARPPGISCSTKSRSIRGTMRTFTDARAATERILICSQPDPAAPRAERTTSAPINDHAKTTNQLPSLHAHRTDPGHDHPDDRGRGGGADVARVYGWASRRQFGAGAFGDVAICADAIGFGRADLPAEF